MSAPDPSVLRRLVAVVEHDLDRLADSYATLYPTPPPDQLNGPVGEYRRHVQAAARELFETARRAQTARARLNDAAAVLERRVVGLEISDERLLPHPSDRGDLKRAQQAKARRDRRAATRTLPWSVEEATG